MATDLLGPDSDDRPVCRISLERGMNERHLSMVAKLFNPRNPSQFAYVRMIPTLSSSDLLIPQFYLKLLGIEPTSTSSAEGLMAAEISVFLLGDAAVPGEPHPARIPSVQWSQRARFFATERKIAYAILGVRDGLEHFEHHIETQCIETELLGDTLFHSLVLRPRDSFTGATEWI